MDEKRKVQLSQEKINFETQRIRLINLELMQCFDAGQNKMYNVMLQNETSAMSDELGRKRKLVSSRAASAFKNLYLELGFAAKTAIVENLDWKF